MARVGDPTVGEARHKAPDGRVIAINHSVDVKWSNRVRASASTFTLKLRRAPIWVSQLRALNSL
jgi:hypothetical protein